MNEKRLGILQNMPIFGGIGEDALVFLLDKSTSTTFSAGDFLFRENDPGDSLYILETGRVAILKRWNRTYYRLSDLTAGDCVGEMSLIDLGRRSASVLALTECEAIQLTSTSLLEVSEYDLEQFALIQMNMSRELSRRLRVSDEAFFREMIQTKQIYPHKD
jgi:CRP-like cAMP-binding protein